MPESKKETYKLIITAEKAESTDARFTIENISLGDNYKPVDAYFQKADGTIIKRIREKGEKKLSNHLLARLACQVFEKQLRDLSPEEKKNFLVCKYNSNSDGFRGIFLSVPEFKKYRNSYEHADYKCSDGSQRIIYSWNVFSNIAFIQECLKHFGHPQDKFVLLYREKTEKEKKSEKADVPVSEESANRFHGYQNPLSSELIKSRNLILRGAPGTGKTYLAKEIAADIVSNGCQTHYSNLTDEQKQRIGFVQFHPSYDYTDFVEGLRPKANPDGTIGFELRNGVFKQFVDYARKDCLNAPDSKNYVFIIDEINRGEISKIFGELFFAIDPGYRGREGEISTQYSNLHSNQNEKFFIPENVYIIGTRNDIDRSVDRFDFAMRRRFRFIEIKADDPISLERLSSLEPKVQEEGRQRRAKLNKEIASTEGLNENYQIGAAYFLKLKALHNDFNQLWTDYLQPLLQEYIRGIYSEKEIMSRFEKAYGYPNPSQGSSNEADQNQR